MRMNNTAISKVIYLEMVIINWRLRMKNKKPLIIGLFLIAIMLLMSLAFPSYNFGKTIILPQDEKPSGNPTESESLDCLIADAKSVIENAKPINSHILYDYSASNNMKTEEIWYTNGKVKIIGTDSSGDLISYRLALPNDNIIYEYVDTPFHPANTVTLNENYFPDVNEHISVVEVDWDHVRNVRTIQYLSFDAFEVIEIHHSADGLTRKEHIFDADTGFHLASTITINGEIVLEKEATLVEYRKINNEQFIFDLDMPVETIEY